MKTRTPDEIARICAKGLGWERFDRPNDETDLWIWNGDAQADVQMNRFDGCDCHVFSPHSNAADLLRSIAGLDEGQRRELGKYIGWEVSHEVYKKYEYCAERDLMVAVLLLLTTPGGIETVANLVCTVLEGKG